MWQLFKHVVIHTDSYSRKQLSTMAAFFPPVAAHVNYPTQTAVHTSSLLHPLFYRLIITEDDKLLPAVPSPSQNQPAAIPAP
jgi:hypothetical protein